MSLRGLRFSTAMFRPALLLAMALLTLAACSRDDPPPSVANQSAAIANDLEARANALEMQADNLASLEVDEALRNATIPLIKEFRKDGDIKPIIRAACEVLGDDFLDTVNWESDHFLASQRGLWIGLSTEHTTPLPPRTARYVR